jgi:hypothetical protein
MSANALDHDHEEVKGIDEEMPDPITQIWFVLAPKVGPDDIGIAVAAEGGVVPDDTIPAKNVVNYIVIKKLSGLVNMTEELTVVTTVSGNKFYKLGLPVDDQRTLDEICRYIQMNTDNLPTGKPTQPLTHNEFAKCEGVRPVDVAYLAPLNKDNGLYEIILAANKLDMQHLLHLVAAYIALGMRGKTLEEIPNILLPSNKQIVVDEVKEAAAQ